LFVLWSVFGFGFGFGFGFDLDLGLGICVGFGQTKLVKTESKHETIKRFCQHNFKYNPGEQAGLVMAYIAEEYGTLHGIPISHSISPTCLVLSGD
jgi:hypothetical protein